MRPPSRGRGVMPCQRSRLNRVFAHKRLFTVLADARLCISADAGEVHDFFVNRTEKIA